MLINKVQGFVKRCAVYSLFVGASVGYYHYINRAAKTEALNEVHAQMLELGSKVANHEQRDKDRLKLLAETKRLEQTIITAMQISKARLSEIQMIGLTSILAKVASDTFAKFEDREMWIAVIANESKFNPTAKSGSGAVGLGQVMPGSAKYYGDRCGLPEIQPGDLMDPQINAMVSACIFKIMLKATNGSSSMALVAYNAGEFSKDVSRIDGLSNINTESANYVAKIARFLEKTRHINTPDNK